MALVNAAKLLAELAIPHAAGNPFPERIKY
jgi:hypothetical protein